MTRVEEWDRAHLWRFRALWLPREYMDGDTITVLTDNGHGSRYEPRIRLLGYNAAERYAEGGPEATTKLRLALAKSLHLGMRWGLRIESRIKETVVVETKTFDRYVSVVSIVDTFGEMTDIMEYLR